MPATAKNHRARRRGRRSPVVLKCSATPEVLDDLESAANFIQAASNWLEAERLGGSLANASLGMASTRLQRARDSLSPPPSRLP
jgi:hypothetical protein